MTQLDIGDTQTLIDLQAALGRFASGARESLNLADAEICRTKEWLHERVSHWQREVERARRGVAQAEADLHRCQASGYRDERGYYHQPDCSGQARALERAHTFLRECENHLRTAQLWRSRVEQAVNEYQRSARRLADVASTHTERARAFIDRATAQYESVLASQKAIGDMMAAAGAVGRFPALVGAVRASLGTAVGSLNPLIGAVGEDINVSVVLEELDLKEVKFDQAKHGFDRVLQGPSGQIIVFESKTTGGGKLVLKPTKDGHKQGSVGWVERVAKAMTVPTNAQYSIDNERIGRQILEQGAHKVPVLAAVLNPHTGLTDIYLRTDDSAKAWVILSGELVAGGEP